MKKTQNNSESQSKTKFSNINQHVNIQQWKLKSLKSLTFKTGDKRTHIQIIHLKILYDCLLCTLVEDIKESDIQYIYIFRSSRMTPERDCYWQSFHVVYYYCGATLRCLLILYPFNCSIHLFKSNETTNNNKLKSKHSNAYADLNCFLLVLETNIQIYYIYQFSEVTFLFKKN